MDLLEVKEETLDDGSKFTGTAYIMNNKKIPHGYGRKDYSNYYSIGKYVDGILNGPVYTNHNHYMITCQAQNNRANGWGMMINKGILSFGVYRNSQFVLDLTHTVEWYYDKILKQNHQGNMFQYYPKTGEIFIGIPGKQYDNFRSCFMGFHFMDDGSLYLGTTNNLKKNGPMLKFNNNGFIEIGEWENGELISNLSTAEIIDEYWGTDISDPIFGRLLSKKSMRAKYNQIEIDCSVNYFNSL